MKSVFFILVIVIVANSANLEERDGEEGCNVSQKCQQEVENYKVCQELTGLARGMQPATGPCITCPDESTCCCAAPDKGSGRSGGICGISEECQKEIEDEDCQGQDRGAGHMLDSSLGCADGSRCWCFMQ